MDVATRNSLCVGVVEYTRAKSLQTFQSDVLGSVCVRMGRVTASYTAELVASISVSLFGVSALAASLAGVLRVDSDQGYTSTRSLVVEERPQLCKAPSMQRRTLVLPSLYPAPDATEVFNGNSTRGAFSELYDSFGNFVVGVSDKA